VWAYIVYRVMSTSEHSSCLSSIIFYHSIFLWNSRKSNSKKAMCRPNLLRLFISFKMWQTTAFLLPPTITINWVCDRFRISWVGQSLFPFQSGYGCKDQNVFSSVQPIFLSSNKFYGLKRQFIFYRRGCKRRIFYYKFYNAKKLKLF